jgi:hypothetical protein
MPLELTKIQSMMIEDMKKGDNKYYTPFQYAKRIDELEKDKLIAKMLKARTPEIVIKRVLDENGIKTTWPRINRIAGELTRGIFIC